MNKYLKNWKIVFILLLLPAIFLRIWQLDKVPTGISDDELGFLINAKAVFLTGKDIAGNWSPFSLTTVTNEFPQAELPYLIMAPFIGLPGFSLFMSKLPYAGISILAIVLLILITRKLIGKNEAIVVALTAAFNPWSIIFGRTAYEAPLAICLYIAAFYILLIARRWKILIAFVPLFLAFYSYMGTKLILIPFVAILSFYSWYFIHKKQFGKQYLTLCALSLFLFLFFLSTVQSQSTGSRLSEISSPANPAIAKAVDIERKLAIKTPLAVAFSNKPVVWAKESVSKYLKVFSTEHLFVTGEGRSPFSLWYHGYFYYIDFIFLIAGFIMLFIKKRKVWYLLTALILIAPIPAVASNSTGGFAALRASLMYQVFIILIGFGIWCMLSNIKKSQHKIIFGCVLILLYGIQLLNFINIYFFRNPIYNSEAYSLSSRLTSKYILLAEKNNRKVTLVANNPRMNFYHYLFETNNYNAGNTQAISKLLNKNQLRINNVIFVHCLRGLKPPPDHTVIVSAEAICEYIDPTTFESKLSISRLSDGSSLFYILNDNVCKAHNLKRAPSMITFSDLGIEGLSKQQFCEKYIFETKVRDG